jgi:glycosyltransferase involved in cell wall biosynthesis
MVSAPPRVSVAIRAYRERWLTEAIDSVLDSSFADLELVIYDDRGGLEAIATRRGDPRVRYHRPERHRDEAGRFAAAVALCRGEFIGLLDDDDRYETGFLAAAVAALDADPRAGAAISRGAWLTEDGVEVPPDPRPAGPLADLAGDILAFRAFATPSMTLLRRAAWEQLVAERPLPSGVAPDAWIHVNLAELGWAALLVGDGPLVVRRWHREQVSNSSRVAGIVVRTFEQLRLESPDLDAIRRTVLARKRVRLAIGLLAGGDAASCREQLRVAARDDARAWRLPRLATRVAARLGPLGGWAARAALALERRLAAGPPPLYRPDD